MNAKILERNRESNQFRNHIADPPCNRKSQCRCPTGESNNADQERKQRGHDQATNK